MQCGDMLPPKGAKNAPNLTELHHFGAFSEGGDRVLWGRRKSPKQVFNHLFAESGLRGGGKWLVFRLFAVKIGVWYTD